MQESIHDLGHLCDEGRIGQVTIARDRVFDTRVRKALSQCVIVRAEMLWSEMGAVRYELYSPDFPALGPAVIALPYLLYEDAAGDVRWSFDSNIDQLRNAGFTVFSTR